jgi:hypothetical protein
LIFILIFKKQITKFIDEIAEFDWANKKITRKNDQEILSSETPKIEKVAGESVGRWDYKKLHLNNFLTLNSLNALEWFYRNPGSHTSIDFSTKFKLPTSTRRPDDQELSAILSALEETDLLVLKNNNYEISKEGVEYLQYRKII